MKQFGTLVIVAKAMDLSAKQLEIYIKMPDQVFTFEQKLKKLVNYDKK